MNWDLHLQISRIQAPVTVLGYGRRLGVWVQGCTLACVGCCAKHTWASRPDTAMALPLLAAMIELQIISHGLDGVTISGGEPFHQETGLAGLVDEIRQIESRHGLDLDILVYTGYPFGEVAARTGVTDKIDVLVAEPYDVTRPGSGLFGSDNQTLHLLTERAKNRYSDVWLQSHAHPTSMQVSIFGGEMHATGLPRRGDLERLEQGLAARGVSFRSVSWVEGRVARHTTNEVVSSPIDMNT